MNPSFGDAKKGVDDEIFSLVMPPSQCHFLGVTQPTF